MFGTFGTFQPYRGYHRASDQAGDLPAIEPRAGWREIIVRARGEVERLLEDSPSLRTGIEGAIAREVPRARRVAAASLMRYGEKPRPDLPSITYTDPQILDE
jgi:hypothetical protein